MLCKHQQLIVRHQRLSPRYGSDQQPDLAQGTVCLTESQRARIRVTELVWALRLPNTAGGAFCSHLVCMSTCMGCTREGGYPGSNVYRGVTIALRRGGDKSCLGLMWCLLCDCCGAGDLCCLLMLARVVSVLSISRAVMAGRSVLDRC